MNGYTDEKILMLMLVLFLLMLMLMRQLMVLLMLMLNVDVDADIVILLFASEVTHFGAYHRPSDGHFFYMRSSLSWTGLDWMDWTGRILLS